MRNILFYMFFPFWLWSHNITNKITQQLYPSIFHKNTSFLLWSPVLSVQSALYSISLPGLGQVYNKKYWKIPVIWSLLGMSIYTVRYYNKNYYHYRNSSIAIMSTGDYKKTCIYEQFAKMAMKINRYYNYSVILIASIYVLNIIDALIDTNIYDLDHEKEFSLSPELILQENRNPFLKLSFSIKLKNK